ncbi:hypothetical protein LIER_18747 [Lithospermum erythrorhizon]|uniref:Retrovirus-related Pol polyprotein from transposon TNT 1-94-like beta-barrel domain-containing protein n=1 Tax=Lithospermum erythrorhizon TaxID=34254 RepID=A0AAV3QF51_LITER
MLETILMAMRKRNSATRKESGCSRYMTGKKIYLTHIQPLKGFHVTFGDGAEEKLLEKVNCVLMALPLLNDVLLVEGLTVNLISIRKLCDDDVGTTATNNSPEVTSGVTDGVTDADDSCEDNYTIQRASRIQKNHLVDNIVGQLDQGVTTRRKELVDYRKMVGLIGESYFISKVEPKNVYEALKDEH